MKRGKKSLKIPKG